MLNIILFEFIIFIDVSINLQIFWWVFCIILKRNKVKFLYFQILNCEYFQVSFLVCDSKLNIVLLWAKWDIWGLTSNFGKHESSFFTSHLTWRKFCRTIHLLFVMKTVKYHLVFLYNSSLNYIILHNKGHHSQHGRHLSKEKVFCFFFKRWKSQ